MKVWQGPRPRKKSRAIGHKEKKASRGGRTSRKKNKQAKEAGQETGQPRRVLKKKNSVVTKLGREHQIKRSQRNKNAGKPRV